jgi:hypothetical protein
MALNLDKTKKAEAEAPAVAAEAAAPAAVEAPAAEAAPTGVADDTVGTLSDKIAFVAPLGNPLRDDVTTVKDKTTGAEEKKTTPFIVGYRFRALVDLDVPECGTTDKFKKDYMDYADINGTKHVPAGETFDLTPFEMAVLAARKEVNRTFSGGEATAVCAFSKKEMQNKVGDASNVTVREFPRAVLRLSEGSIKDYPYVEVCTKTMETAEDGTQRKKGVINPGFEKWAPLCKTTPRTTTARSGAAAGDKTKKNLYDQGAANFMQILQSKGYQR